MANEIDIRKLRKDLSMSQAKLAAEVGVDQSTVSLWERDKITPRGPALTVLAGLANKVERQKRRAAQPETVGVA